MGIPGVLSTEDSGPAIGAASVSQGAQANSDVVKSGIQAATMQEQIQKQQQDVEQQHNEIQAAKFNQITGMIDKITKEDRPTARKNLATALNTTSQRLGLGSIPAMTLDQLQNDDETRNNFRTIFNDKRYSSLFSDPDHQKEGMDAIYHEFGAKDGAAVISKMLKDSNEASIQRQKVDAMSGKTQTQVQARQDRLQNSANAQYTATMKNTESALQSADRVNNIIGHISSKELKATPQLAGDLSAALASMFNGGKPATVHGMSQQEFDTMWGRSQNLYGKLTGNAVDTITSAQLDQLSKDMMAMKKQYTAQHEQQYKSFASGMADSVKPKLDERYNAFKSGMTQDHQSASNISPDKIKLALQHYTPEQVEAKIGRKLTAQEKALVGSK